MFDVERVVLRRDMLFSQESEKLIDHAGHLLDQFASGSARSQMQNDSL